MCQCKCQHVHCNFEEGIDLGGGDDHDFIVNDNNIHNVETRERIL